MKTIEAKKLAEWMKSTATDMHAEDVCGMAHIFIDPSDHDLCLAIGWLAGYGSESDGYMKSKSQPCYALNAAIVKYNPADCCDLEFTEMPYDEDTGYVWDTGSSLKLDEDWLRTAEWYIKEYNEIKKWEIMKEEE